jgi:hypothetical protein
MGNNVAKGPMANWCGEDELNGESWRQLRTRNQNASNAQYILMQRRRKLTVASFSNIQSQRAMDFLGGFLSCGGSPDMTVS